jgi:hypothetical protein
MHVVLLSSTCLGGRRLRGYLANKEISNCASDFLMMGFQSEVTGTVEMHLGAGIVTFECFCAYRNCGKG